MVMKSGERWQCVNPACGCAVVVESNRRNRGTKSPMRLRRHWEKKGYSPPVFRYLDLLRFPEAAFVHRDSSED